MLLHHMREMFNADIAEVLLWPEGRDRPSCVVRSGRATRRSPSNPCPWIPRRACGLALHPSANRSFSRGRSATKRSGASSVIKQIRDAIVVPLSSDDKLLGILTVADRLDDFSTFDQDDLELFQTLANHVAVALRNSLLLERLERALAHETEMSRLKDEFVATVSHELRTPSRTSRGPSRRSSAGIFTSHPRSSRSSCWRRTDIPNASSASSRTSCSRPASNPTSRPRGRRRRSVSPASISRVVEDEAHEDGRERIDVVISDTVPPVLGIEEDVYRIVRNPHR